MITGPKTSRKTFHIEIDTLGFDESYRVGDSVAILPTNDEKEVRDILHLSGLNGDQELFKFLTEEANLNRINRALITLIVEKGGLSPEILEIEYKEKFTHLLRTHTLKDLLQHGSLTKEEIMKNTMPMLPRFYSIASSPKVYRDELHILVAHLQYELNGQTRVGVGSDFLGFRAKIESTPIPIYVQPATHFTLPEDSCAPIIMIGPGTGVAPFRAFLQERIATRGSGKNWLFFGGRNKKSDFYYESFWKDLERQGLLRLDTAFSRDTSEKVYVQHQMLMQKKDLWEWIKEGAFIYVCGDAKQMAREVEIALCQIIHEEGNLSEEEALHFFRKMRKEKRYLADVY